MKRLVVVLFSVLSVCSVAFGVTRISLAELDADGWSKWKGRQVCITTPLVVCGTFKDSLALADERLFVPEERATGLADGDSTAYWQRVAYNASKRIRLNCKYPYSLNLGATIRNLTAVVTGERQLLSAQQPTFKNFRPDKQVPKFPDADVIVCAANIQNYFVHLGGYATRRTSPGQHTLQSLKTAHALCQLNADVYALCELEKGPSAPAELVAAMNQVCRKERYAFVATDATDGDTISVGYVYRLDRVRPYGAMQYAYEDKHDIYAYRFLLQGFEHIASGERFAISLNHTRSKRGNPQDSNAKRMDNTEHILNCIQSWSTTADADPDVLLLGDYNCYTYEQPLQTIVRAGYDDLLATDSLHYTYSYKGECGSLDRVFATPSMTAQVLGVEPIHWNTDYYYSAAYYSKYNFKNNLIPAQVTDLKAIIPYLSKQAKKNLLFRYSDHDPVLIGIKLNRK